MGGRGSSSGTSKGMLGRSSSISVKNEQTIVDAIAKSGAGLYANQIMKARDNMEKEYGNIISSANLSVADVGSSALGAYGQGTVYMSNKYVKNPNMTQAMKQAEKDGFHPAIGDKSGVEAVTSHELGHFLADKACTKAKISERELVSRASKRIGVKPNNMAATISEYARYNYAETIAEASADVYCNGSKASRASIAIMSEIKSILK